MGKDRGKSEREEKKEIGNSVNKKSGEVGRQKINKKSGEIVKTELKREKDV
jgi:hypothetical protein